MKRAAHEKVCKPSKRTDSDLARIIVQRNPGTWFLDVDHDVLFWYKNGFLTTDNIFASLGQQGTNDDKAHHRVILKNIRYHADFISKADSRSKFFLLFEDCVYDPINDMTCSHSSSFGFFHAGMGYPLGGVAFPDIDYERDLEQRLFETMGDKKQLFCEMVGKALAGIPSDKIIVLEGPPQTGKSVTFYVLECMAGTNAEIFPMEMFRFAGNKMNSYQQDCVDRLKDKRFVLCKYFSFSSFEKFKRLTQHEGLTALFVLKENGAEKRMKDCKDFVFFPHQVVFGQDRPSNKNLKEELQTPRAKRALFQIFIRAFRNWRENGPSSDELPARIITA